jgi:hypothetical protein
MGELRVKTGVELRDVGWFVFVEVYVDGRFVALYDTSSPLKTETEALLRARECGDEVRKRYAGQLASDTKYPIT